MRSPSADKPLTKAQSKFIEKLFKDNYILIAKRMSDLLAAVDPDGVEDCLGNLFLTLCLSAEKVMERQNPRAWLFLTGKYICLKHIRNVGRASKNTVRISESVADEISDNILYEDKIIDDILWCQWKNQNMRARLIAELNENERNILDLRVEQGLSNKEIGERIGKTEDAVRFTLYYIRKKITAKVYSGNL